MKTAKTHASRNRPKKHTTANFLLTTFKKYSIRSVSKEREVNIMILTNSCPFCGKESEVAVTMEGWSKYVNGFSVQTAFPKLSATEREIIISGICPKCQESIFGGDDDE